MSDVVYTLAGPETVKTVKPFHQRKKVKKFSWGVIEKLTASVVFAGLTVLVGATAVYFAQPVDTTPTVYIDKETECQYLVTSAGITPRMGANGNQLCGQ